MLDKKTVEAIIEDCLLRIEMFDARHDGKARGKMVRIRTNATDGGGMSTYGLTYVFGPDDHYECHDGYLYIHREFKDYNPSVRERMLTESVAFIPYESIVAIECSVSAYV